MPTEFLALFPGTGTAPVPVPPVPVPGEILKIKVTTQKVWVKAVE